MMGTLAGLLLLHGLLLAVGFAFLHATGVVRMAPRSALSAVGLAHLTGVALTGLASVVVLVIGASVSAPVFVAIMAALTAGLLGASRLREAPPPSMSRRGSVSGARDWPGIALGGVLGGFIVVQMARSLNLPTAWDAAHNWTLKAAVLFHQGDLGSGVFRDPELFTGAHQQYPILHPAIGSLVFEFSGKVDHGLLVAELWILVGALVGACVFLLRDRSISSALVLAPLGLAVASGTTAGILRGDADVTMAVFLTAGALCVGLWLESGSRALLPVAVVLLAAAVNTKNEGLVFAVPVVAVAALLSIRRGSRDRLDIALAAGALGLAIVPWRVWAAINGPFPSDVRPLREALSPSFLADHLNQLNLGAKAILSRSVDGSGSGWLIPALLVLACVAVVAGGDRRGLAFYLGSLLAMFGAVLWVYWTSPQPDVAAHIDRTSMRTVTAPIFMAAAGLALAFSGIRHPAGLGEP